jgi:branched-chain amino acid transport system ATP-binding protein
VPDTPRAAVLELRGLAAGYGDLAAVRDVNLHICPGEIVALFGPNGAGKTTTLLAAVGVLPRMRGEVHWRAQPTTKSLHNLARDGLAFVPEECSLVTSLTARDNLRLGRGSVDDALARFAELEPLLSQRAGLLSGCQDIQPILRMTDGRHPGTHLRGEPDRSRVIDRVMPPAGEDGQAAGHQ